MNYSELLLDSRKRVHDARDENGNIITDATEDGIRWTSDHLARAMQEALMEFTRDILSLNFKSYFNSAYLYRFIPGTVATTGIFTPVGTEEINDIIRIETPLGATRYTHVDPDRFFSDEYQNNTLEEESYVFTQVTVSPGNAITTYVLPLPTADIPVRAFCDVNLELLFSLDNTDELPFHNVDDLMLDYIARNCNLIEHDMQQFDLYNKVIDKKLQIIKARDVKEMGK